MSDQKIEIGSEWVHVDGAVDTVVSVIEHKGKTSIVFDSRSEGGYLGMVDKSRFLAYRTPHIREPQVGEVWKWKIGDSSKEFEIVAPPRECLGEREIAVWYEEWGYDSHRLALVLEKAKYLRQRPL